MPPIAGKRGAVGATARYSGDYLRINQGPPARDHILLRAPAARS